MKNDTQHTDSTMYRVVIDGHLDMTWSTWFHNLEITHRENGTTSLSGYVIDQTVLQSILVKIGKLNLTLISVNQITEKS